jgi:hypothetical protein
MSENKQSELKNLLYKDEIFNTLHRRRLFSVNCQMFVGDSWPFLPT